MMKRIAVILVCSIAIADGAAAAREGFGFSKRGADMVKTVPPALNVAGTKVTVNATSRSRFADEADTLRKYTEEAILASKRFEVAAQGDIKVAIDLDRMEVRTRNATKVTTRQEKYKDKDGKDRYRSVPETKTYTVLNADIAGGYTITDRRGGQLDAGDFDDSEEKEYEYSYPNESRIKETYLRNAAEKIAGRIAPTKQTVRVLLPRGSFESFIPLAERGAWDQYLRAVEGVPAKRDPASEAYRQYALGVAREALAYSTDDPKQAFEMLRMASDHYRNAISQNPQEKLFSQGYGSLLNATSAPIARVETSLTAYERWTSGPAVAAKFSIVPKASTSMASSKGSNPSSGTLRNQQIIEMSNAGLSEENIILAIDGAAATDFDVTPSGLIALSKAGVNKRVISAMQKNAKR